MVVLTDMKRLALLLSLFALSLTPMQAAPATPAKTEFLVVGGGCFWCTEAAYEILPGVKSVVSGYAGGQTKRPTYEEIGTGRTGHAEVIRIEFDPAQTTLEGLLEFFWDAHDPTQVNGQGNDIGPQYRSIILYADETQRVAAEKSREVAQKDFRDPIATEIVPLEKFWPAEGYHQDYFRLNPNAGYCRFVIAPKVNKLEKQIKKTGK
jgi:peptide-methionine (S)-S-oxide reductase